VIEHTSPIMFYTSRTTVPIAAMAATA